jgi:hypothetical protein
MPQLVKKRRSGWALLAAGALVASLLAVGASPVSADHPNALNLRGDKAPFAWPWNSVPVWPWTSACVGDALDDHMFTDVSEGHAFTDAINCIAYYGVTNGTGDGSTYSPSQDVSRAEMAVFIARAATAAGVDLGSGSGGFSDIGDVWPEAQDAINRLAAKGMIPAGGAFRPDDAITRAEMATFLFGLLLEGSTIVSLANVDNVNRPCTAVSETCEIRLGVGAQAEPVNDWFPDARDSEPLEVDKHISAMWELGVTGGAEALPPGPRRAQVEAVISTRAWLPMDTGGSFSGMASVVTPVPLWFNDDGQATFSVAGLADPLAQRKGDKYDIDVSVRHFPPDRRQGPWPLPYNYDPDGTVNRGEMAAFITRALAHTSVRPAGVSAQYEIHERNVIVSVRDDDFQPVSNTVVDVFYTDTPGVDLAFRGDGSCGEVEKLQGTYSCEIDKTDSITGGTGDTPLRLVPPELDDVNGTTVWAWTGDDEDQVDDGGTGLFRLDIPGGIFEPATMISVINDHGGSKAHLGSSVAFTLQLRDKYGRATTRWYDPWLKFVDGRMSDLAEDTDLPTGFKVMGNTEADTHDTNSGFFTGVFSTEDSLAGDTVESAQGKVSVYVSPNPSFVAANARGAATRVTVSVFDQYGDPLPRREVRLRTERTTPESRVNDKHKTRPANIVIANDAHLAVGRGGSYTFGYERSGEAGAESDQLTAIVERWDHDGDGCGTVEEVSAALATTAIQTTDDAAACYDDPMTTNKKEATSPLTPDDGSNVVQWASAAAGMSAGNKQILAIDTDTNTIFVGTVDTTASPMVASDSVEVIHYDSNDRFNIYKLASGEVDETGAVEVDVTGVTARAASYAQFERSLFNLKGFVLSWEIVGSGSRAVNEYTLYVPHDDDLDPVRYPW